MGETPIPFSLFNYSFDHLSRTGFCFDLGGKISLGRYYDEPNATISNKNYGKLKYQLICTPEKMLRYIESDYFAIDRLLPIELLQSIHVAGNPTITLKYQELLTKRLNTPQKSGHLFRHERAMEMLMGNGILNGDIALYRPDYHGNAGAVIDVKKEVFRLPDRLISDICFFYAINDERMVKKIEALLARKIINIEQAQDLKIIDGIAKELRLKTYLYYGRQKELLTLMPMVFREDEQLRRELDVMTLERFFITAEPFTERLEEFCKQWQSNPKKINNILSKGTFRNFNLITYSNIAYRLGLIERRFFFQSELIANEKKQGRTHTFSYFQSLKLYGATLGKLDDQTQQIKVQESALALLIQYHSNHEEERADILMQIGNAYGVLCNFQKQIQLQQQARLLFEKCCGKESLEVALIMINLGNAIGEEGNYKQQLAFQEHALSICEKNEKTSMHLMSILFNNIGNAYYGLGDYVYALSYYQRAFAAKEKIYGQNHLELVTQLCNFTAVYFCMADYKHALYYAETALAILQSYHRTESTIAYSVYDILGLVHGFLGDLELQLAYTEQHHLLTKRRYGDDHPKTAWAGVQLAQTYARANQIERAEGLINKSLDIFKNKYNSNHKSIFVAEVILACIQGLMGNYKLKTNLLLELLPRIALRFSQDNPLYMSTQIVLAFAYCDSESDLNKAHDILVYLLTRYEQLPYKQAYYLGFVLQGLAYICELKRNFEKEAFYLHKAHDILTDALDMDHPMVVANLVLLGQAPKDRCALVKTVAFYVGSPANKKLVERLQNSLLDLECTDANQYRPF